MEKPGKSFLLGRPALLFCVLLIMLSAGFAAQAADNPSDVQTTLQLARTLLNDHRYMEAAALLERQLEVQAPGSPRLALLLLEADAWLGMGDLSKAGQILEKANQQAVKPSEKKAVEKRRVLLDKLALKQPPLQPVEITPSPADTVTDVAATAFQAGRTPVTNSFFETDLRQVLTDLSQESGVPILWDATVQGLVTYEAKTQPLEDVLRAILLPAGFTFTLKDGAYFVGSARPEDPAFGLLSQTDAVVMANLDATEAMGLLSDYFKPYVKASKSSNMICITAPPNMVERIKNDLKTLDAPPDQIVIEVIVTEISKDAAHQVGINWSALDSTAQNAWSLAIGNTNITSPGITGYYSEPNVKIGQNNVDIMATLQALVTSGDAKIRANPRVTTMNARTAQISLVTDQYFIIQTGSSQYYQYNTLQAVSSGIKLEITPFTSKSGEITLYVKPEVGDVAGNSSNGLPEINRRAAATSVRVKDGETFSIGGLSLQTSKNMQKKIPFLGDIPILGYLFRYDSHDRKDSEIIIFVTPHILKG
jgi:type IV pilus assembly protein PilQ